MVRQYFIAMIITITALGASSFAQQTDPRIAAVLQASLRSMVGSSTPRDVVLNGSVEFVAGSQDEAGSLIAKAILPRASLIQLDLPSGTRKEVYLVPSGTPTGFLTGTDGVSHVIVAHNLLGDNTWFFPAFTLVKLLSQDQYVVAYAGEEQRDSGLVEHFTASLNAGALQGSALLKYQRLSHLDLYLDSKTLLPVSLAFGIHPDNDDGLTIPVRIEYSTYTNMAGVLLPSRIHKFVNGTLQLNIQSLSLALNTGTVIDSPVSR